MASGVLGTSTPSATTWTSVYQVPASMVATVNVSVANRNSSSATFRLAVSDNATPSNGEHLVYDYTLGAAGTPASVFQYTGLVLDAGARVTVYASGTGVDFVVVGYEA